jgi:tRNA(adenine34) deaminase
MISDEIFMKRAIDEAARALDHDDVPIGAVIVKAGRVIARGHNQVELLRDPTAHAEMIAVTAAAEALGSKWLSDCTLYVTIEPCSMCAGALVLARIPRVVFGAVDLKAGAGGSIVDILDHKKLNHRVKVTPGVLEGDCAALVKEFFKKKRVKGN